MTPRPFTAITDALERAARNGTRAHLGPDLVRALVASDAYQALYTDRIKELQSIWQEERAGLPHPAEPNSGRSGSGTGHNGTTGPSAGTMTEVQEASVGLAASRLASEAVAAITRPKKRKTL